MLWARRLLTALFVFEAAVALAAYALIAGLLIADVAARELFSSSVWGAQRISVYAMIFTGFLGLGLATATGRHLRPTLADGLLPAQLAGAAQRLGNLLMAAVFLAFAWFAFEFVRESWIFGDLARVIRIPVWWLQLVIPYAFASTALRHILYALWPATQPTEGFEA